VPEWEQYAWFSRPKPGPNGLVILKMRNNSNGGCGNDLAIDDIVKSPVEMHRFNQSNETKA